ncbi:MAG: hypothetical protein HYV26_02765 [Candidatus Hydrogenedentes bacterium]|nr:hypothetical protein [Candidatus Hydrogenedentota bacterium]MBI3119343.1 hypothetical protein [Candidatus Hydrogenedentota bacterium]
MITPEDAQQTADDLSLEQRRQFLRLPLQERRRILAVQAALLKDHYCGPSEEQERQWWQGGDIAGPA